MRAAGHRRLQPPLADSRFVDLRVSRIDQHMGSHPSSRFTSSQTKGLATVKRGDRLRAAIPKNFLSSRFNTRSAWSGNQVASRCACHSRAMTSKRSASAMSDASRCARRCAPGSTPLARSFLNSSRFSRTSLSDTSGYVPRLIRRSPGLSRGTAHRCRTASYASS